MTSTAYAYNADTMRVIAKVTASDSAIALAILDRAGYLCGDEIGVCFTDYGLVETDDTIVIDN